MDSEWFAGVVREFQEEEDGLLIVKRMEYASDADRLENFKTNAALTGLMPEQVCAVYLAKHVQSIVKHVMDGQFDWSWTTEDGREGLKQRIADARNYLLLLAACIDESRTHVPQVPTEWIGIHDVANTLVSIQEKNGERRFSAGGSEDAIVQYLNQLEATLVKGEING
jgi:hypothetical protein